MEQTMRIRDYLREQGCRCYLSSEFMSPGKEDLFPEMSGSVQWHYTNARKIPNDVECVLVLGGDGTLLEAARDLVDTGLPLLGINLGTLGFLAEIEIDNVQNALDLLIRDEYTLEQRMMLKGSLYRQGRLIMEDTALNDIALIRRGRLRVVDFKVYVRKTFLCAYRADGCILATPTGSTGYSLSAGGPIVSPDASLLLMTPVAPHTISSRPVVLPDTAEVEIEIGGGAQEEQRQLADITFDGDTALAASIGDILRVCKSDRHINLIKVKNTSFVEVLRNKMK